MIKKARQPALTGTFFGELKLFKIVYDVADGDELVGVIFSDLDAKLLFTHHDKIGKLNRVDAKVLRELRIKRDLAFIKLQLINQNLLYFIKHIMSSKSYYLHYIEREGFCQAFSENYTKRA